MKKAELIIATVIVFSLIMKASDFPFSSLLFLIGASALSMLYFAGGFALFPDKNASNSEKIIGALSGVGLSIVPVGVLFKIQHWPMANVYLILGGVVSIGVIIVLCIMNATGRGISHRFFKSMLFRSAILALISWGLYAYFTFPEMNVQL